MQASTQAILRHLRLGHAPLEVTSQHHTVWCGDLNYRLEGEREAVLRLVASRAWAKLRALDQLATERGRQRLLFDFEEAELAFAPSYKYVRERDELPERGAHPAG